MKIIKLVFLLICFQHTYGEINSGFKVDTISSPCDTLNCPEIFAEFPGGDGMLFKFIENNVIYPDSSYNNKIGGRVYISFVIDTVGNIIDPSVIKGINQELNEEALRVILSLPKFHPAQQCCKYVKVKFNLPVSFDPKKKRNRKNK